MINFICERKISGVRLIAAATLLLAMAGCGGGGGGGGLTAQAPTTSATPAPTSGGGASSGIVMAGKVVDTDGNAISGASVKLPDGSTVTSGADGSFTYSPGSATEVKVSTTRGGYVEAFDKFQISQNAALNGKVSVTVTMRRAASTAAEGTNASITRADGSTSDVAPTAVSAGGATVYESVVTVGATDRAVEFTTPAAAGAEPSVKFTIGSADGSGANAAAVLGLTGAVTASISYGDPTDADDLAVFPGDFTTQSDTGFGPSGNGALITAGFARITLKDASGNPITKFADGTSATIEMTVAAGVVNPETGKIVKPGDTIPIFIFNEGTGEWVVEHEADGSVKRSTVQNDNNGRMFVQFTTTHLTEFNLDWKSATCASGTPKVSFVDDAGSPVSKYYVYTKSGAGWDQHGSYNADSYSTFRNSPADVDWKVWAVKDGVTSDVGTIKACKDITVAFHFKPPEPPKPACSEDTGCNDSNGLTYDKCINPGLMTSYCSNAACSPVCTSAAQCDDGKSYTTDTCEGAGTCTAFCKHSSCAVACSSDSACNDGNSLTVDACTNAGTCSAACTHTACTPACNTAAQCDDGNPLTLDACSSGGTCSAACSHTACTAACSSNSDCNDNNALTTDTCNNAGTCSAACQNTACSIACANDAACNDNNALTIDACANPGTCSSACSHTNCNVACANDAACNDNNALTIDACSSPGTCSAACSHTACSVACSANADCNDNNANTTDVCNSGGTCSAACSHAVSTCSLSLNKVNYAPGETMTITFTVANAGSSAVLCGAESTLKNGQGAVSWNSFSENLYVTIPANTATTTLTMNKVVPLEWTGTDTSQGSDYDMHPVHFGGERWASGDNFNLHFKRAACSANSDCNDNNAATTDTCINPALYDAACVNASCTPVCTANASCDDGNPLTLDVCNAPATCSAACSNTACTPACTADANCNDNNPLTSDACSSPNTCSAACSFTPCNAACINDANCDDGNPLTADACSNPNTCSAACSNTPCTAACTADADCNDNNALTNDSCTSPNSCSAACVNAACTPACTADGDCNDSNALTNDSCSSPNSCSAACVNAACTPACTADGDCNDGNGLTIDACSNPNTCGAACSNTACTPACTIDGDCNDNNALTNDTCNNPNTCASSCTNTACTAACTADGDCDDSNALTIDTCNNPNTCAAACNHAACTPACTNDADCNDFIGLTADTCSNPNTCAAACSNTPCTAACTSNGECDDGNFRTADVCDNPNTCTAACSNTLIPNNLPVITANSSTTLGLKPLSVNFTGTCSDSDGTCVSYQWDFGDGSPTSNALSPTHVFTTTGTFNVTFTATDNFTDTSTATLVVTVTQSPVASINAPIVSGGAPLNLFFTGGCTDDGTCVSYSWDFGDGSPTSSLQSPSHEFAADGSYTVTLTVTDNDGRTGTASVGVTVGAVKTNTRISAGMYHTCALTAAGGASCWGDNSSGQLGNGNYLDSALPVAVSGLSSGLAGIYAGYDFTCAVTTGGGVKCWGNNNTSQLGNGSNTNSYMPVDVTGLTSGVVSVSPAFNHACAVTTGGGVKCWGDNSYGQLGNGTTATATTPVDVTGLTSGVSAVASAGNSTCALLSDGTVQCWGQNTSGQLGDGTTVSRSTAAAVSGITGATQIEGGTAHFCAVLNTGDLKCWGLNTNGQLGDGTTTARLTPVSASGLTSGVAIVEAGNNHTCVVQTIGSMRCFGMNTYGQVGDGTTADKTTSTAVSGLSGQMFVITAGGQHTCAMPINGQAKCWGNNNHGQIGNGYSSSTATPWPLPSSLTSGVTQVTGGDLFTCAIVSGGLKCMGLNTYGQLGDGSTVSKTTPVSVTGLTSGVAGASAGLYQACAVITGGAAKCWGGNSNGQLGNNTFTSSSTPVNVSGLASGTAAVSSGYLHTCARTTAGGVKCWGDNAYGELGNGTFTTSKVPVDVTGLTSGVTALVTRGYFSCALTTGGAVKCWGRNNVGQLGNGTLTNSNVPVDVTGLSSGMTAIYLGSAHACAATNAGGFKCWGSNAYGQLGNGVLVDSSVPVDVTVYNEGTGSLALGPGTSCVVTPTGGMKCWGLNDFGELGVGTTANSTSALDVYGLSSGVASAMGGGQHTCAIISGALKCWGNNNYGQLGLATSNTTVPTTVLSY